MSAHFRLIFALLILASTALTQAADIEVTGDCTLAAAIVAANTDAAVGSCPAGDGADAISLSDSIELDDDLPAITSEIVISGDFNSISGAGSFRIFFVAPEGSLTLSETNLTRGKTDARGGAIYNAQTELTVRDSQFTNNSASSYGGAIRNYFGTVRQSGNTFSGNRGRAGDCYGC